MKLYNIILVFAIGFSVGYVLGRSNDNVEGYLADYDKVKMCRCTSEKSR